MLSRFPNTLDTASFSREVLPYGFNGKERDNSTASDSYDFGARILDTRLGRWLSVDSKYFRHFDKSVYAFTSDNPIMNLDSDGNDFIASKNVQPSVESHIRLAFGSSEGISWDRSGKMLVDREKLHSAAVSASSDGKLSVDQGYLFNSFIDGQVLNQDLLIKYDENKNKETATIGENETLGYNDAVAGKARVSININSDQKNFEEKVNDTATGKVVKEGGVELTKEEKKATAFWHEIGHIHIWKKIKTKKDLHQKQAVGFENFFRRIIGATERAGNKHGKQGPNGEYDKNQKGNNEPYDSPRPKD